MATSYNFLHYRSSLIEKFNVPGMDFDEQHASWKQRFGHSSEQEKTFLWQFMERWSAVLKQESDIPERRYKQLQAFYLLMWEFLIGERKPAGAQLELANWYHLKQAELFKFKTLVQVIAGPGCTAATQADGFVVPIEDALQEQPIPYANCSRPLGCICCYGFQAERDLNDQIILK
jgi:hypothetical protein